MKHILYILLLLAAVGCTKDTDVIDSQQTAIEKYLTSSHQPVLQAYDDVDWTLNKNHNYYTVAGDKAYRYIATTYTEGRDSWTEVAVGDTIEISFDAYIFTGSTPSATALYWSNRQTSIDALAERGLDTSYWSAEPLAITLGQTEIIKGLAVSLEGCREGDTVEVYMSFNMAYKKSIIMGTLPHESSVAWYFTIDKVIKN